ncbi:MAG: pilus assembly protein [Planctomycetaceae bacterium]|nr:pilus assembly protein [Planctomycetaceae bacterium]
MRNLRHEPRRVRQADPRRKGVVLVEMAIVISVFAVFMAGVIEFGHAYLVIGSLNAATRGAARLGTVDDVTTSDVVAEANRILGSAFDNTRAVVRVKNAGVFDTPGIDPTTIDYAALPDVEVDDLEAGDLFVVRIDVEYEDVSLMPPFWAKNLTLRSQSVMRHE